MRIEILPIVELDFDGIVDYIAQDDPVRAVTFVREIRGRFRGIAQNPQVYRLRPELGRGVRLVPVGRYVIVFRILGDTVFILRVLHGARDLKKLLR